MPCSGKVYYDLLEKRRAEGREDIAILRLEQLYPFPEDDLVEIHGAIQQPQARRLVPGRADEPGRLVQQPASPCAAVLGRHNKALVLEYAGRDASAAPACGYASKHAEQQEKLLQDAFTV